MCVLWWGVVGGRGCHESCVGSWGASGLCVCCHRAQWGPGLTVTYPLLWQQHANTSVSQSVTHTLRERDWHLGFWHCAAGKHLLRGMWCAACRPIFGENSGVIPLKKPDLSLWRWMDFSFLLYHFVLKLLGGGIVRRQNCFWSLWKSIKRGRCGKWCGVS